MGAVEAGVSASLAAAAFQNGKTNLAKLKSVWGTKSNSEILRDNLKKAGYTEPDYKNAAHHMVPATAEVAGEARIILRNCGIDINDAANGVFLPTETGHGTAAVHRGIIYRK